MVDLDCVLSLAYLLATDSGDISVVTHLELFIYLYQRFKGKWQF